MSALTTFAVLAQREAERQRGQAEALVEFMLTDLRDRLKGVGRLDVLTTVNERTLAYYADQKIEDLPAASQARYARILHAMGEDEISRRDAIGAAEKFRTAEKITAQLLAKDGSDVERLWGHSQSEYWLGYHAYLWGEREDAAARWARRQGLALTLTRLRPKDARYRRELGYAEGDLCALALRERKETPGAQREAQDVAGALRHCGAALKEVERSARMPGRERATTQDLINRHAWLARVHRANEDWPAALHHRLIQERLVSDALTRDPRDQRMRQTWVVLQLDIARLEVRLGRPEPARSRLLKAKSVLDDLLIFDPENAEWAVQRGRMGQAIAYFEAAKRQ